MGDDWRVRIAFDEDDPPELPESGEQALVAALRSRTFPRSRKNSGSLIRALDAWLTAGPLAPLITESWLLGASDSS